MFFLSSFFGSVIYVRADSKAYNSDIHGNFSKDPSAQMGNIRLILIFFSSSRFGNFRLRREEMNQLFCNSLGIKIETGNRFSFLFSEIALKSF